MFNKPGEKLKSLAIILFVVAIIASIALAIIYGWADQYTLYGYGTRDNTFRPLIFFGILISGLITAYVTNLLIYAFGEFVENSAKTSENVFEINQKIQLKYEWEFTEEHLGTKTSYHSKNYSSNPIAIKGDELWICKKCGTINSKEKSVCYDCGESREQDE